MLSAIVSEFGFFNSLLGNYLLLPNSCSGLVIGWPDGVKPTIVDCMRLVASLREGKNPSDVTAASSYSHTLAGEGDVRPSKVSIAVCC